MADKSVKKNIIHCCAVLLGLFGCLFCYLVYIQFVQGDELNANAMNRRSVAGDRLRGEILDCQGTKLAYSDEGGTRYYPYGAVMAPVTGYAGETLGSSGLENSLGDALSGQSRLLRGLGPAGQLLQGEKGCSVKLTVDAQLQQLAYEAMGSYQGAVVVLDADTGAVLAMVSKPAADPADVEANWENLSQRQDSPLLNRAAQGLYPPGSTIKPLIADAALNEKVTDTSEIFNCTGQLQAGNGIIRESHNAVHGEVSLEEALIYSCNYTFGTLAMRLQGAGLADAFERFGFQDSVKGDITEEQCHLPDLSSLSAGDAAQLGIGQGELLVTPLHMAMLAAAFANEGKIMQPYMADEIISPAGIVIKKTTPTLWREVTSAQRAKLIHSFMVQVVEQGTGQGAYVNGVSVAGKTGTAENAAGAEHGWFIGSAQLPSRNIAFCIILENSGSGATAAPIARELIIDLLNR